MIQKKRKRTQSRGHKKKIQRTEWMAQRTSDDSEKRERGSEDRKMSQRTMGTIK